MLREPLVEITVIELNTELLLDQLRETTRGPQISGETIPRRRVPQPTQDRLLLPGTQLRFATLTGLRFQPGFARRPMPTHPLAHRAIGDTQGQCNLDLRGAVQYHLNRQTATFRRAGFAVYHNPAYRQTNSIYRTLLT